jgi:hypothetical protein
MQFDFFCGYRRPYYMPHHFEKYTTEYHFLKAAVDKYGNDSKKLMEKAKFHCNIIEDIEVTLFK